MEKYSENENGKYRNAFEQHCACWRLMRVKNTYVVMEFVMFSYWRTLNVKNVWTVHFVEISRSISVRNENIKFIASMYARNICI